MSHRICISIVTTTLILSAAGLLAAQDTAKTTYPVKWQITDGLQAPESIYFDAESGFLFLSQIGAGGGKAKDGDGWISKISIDGKVIKNKWATGLNAPKGLRAFSGKLWVSDIDRVVCFDIATGQQEKIVPIEGAMFLNDLAIGADGVVYVSDMVASKVYQHKDGKTSVLAEGPELEHPNGLLVVEDRLILGGWGRNFNTDDFSTDPVGRLLSLDLKTRKVTPITKQPTGHLDGIEVDGRGGFYVTDWIDGKVFHITGDGESKTIMNFPKGAADHAYLPDRNLLILPEMLEAKLTAYEVR